MANLTEIATYDTGVYQLETTDPVQGGASGVSNKPLKNLANRTAYLKAQVDALAAAAPSQAPLASPAFTGTPTAPTPAYSDRSTKVATTDHAATINDGVLSKSVAGGSTVTLTADEAARGILVFTGILTANINVVVPATTKKWIVRNATTGSYTLTLKTAAGSGVTIPQSESMPLWCDGASVLVAKTGDLDNIITDAALSPGDGDATVRLRALRRLYGGSAVTISASRTLTVDDAGLVIVDASAGNVTLTLPAASAMSGRPIRYRIARYDATANTVTVQRAGTDTLPGIGPSVTVPRYGMAILESDGAAGWVAFSQGVLRTPVAKVSYLPDGRMLQWGTVTVPANPGSTNSSLGVVFPVAFPTAAESIVANGTAGVSASGWPPVCITNGVTTTGFTLSIDILGGGGAQTITQAQPVRWFAVGY